MRKENKDPETDLNGNVIAPCHECVTNHTARRTSITNMYLNHKYPPMMHVSGHKTQKTFMDYIKLSSEELPTSFATPKNRHKCHFFGVAYCAYQNKCLFLYSKKLA